MKIVLLGTYDLSKPRTRLLRSSLREIDPDLQEIGVDVWKGVGDKSMLTGFAGRMRIALRMLLAYLVLPFRYLAAGRHDLVVIGYMGLFDVILLSPFVKFRGKPVVWDAFLSIYDTYARDREMARKGSLAARILRILEKLATRRADKVVLDTKAHANLMRALHDIAPSKLEAVLVGAESHVFAGDKIHKPQSDSTAPITVLFYGQFIPLHGVSTIVDAALDPRGKACRWTIVGTGQEAARVDERLNQANANHIERIEWIEYDALQQAIADADVTLGIFGTSEKAASVIPNKVYQALLCAKPIVTRASPAMAELAPDPSPGLYLVEPGDPAALLDGLERFASERSDLPTPLHQDLCDQFAMPRLTAEWQRIFTRALAERENS